MNGDNLNLTLSGRWSVFGIFPRAEKTSIDSPPGSCARAGAVLEVGPSRAQLDEIPDCLAMTGLTFAPQTVLVSHGALNLATVLGNMQVGDTAYVYIPVETERAQHASLGFGADWWMQVWVNGELMIDTTSAGNGYPEPKCDNHLIDAALREGRNMIVVRLISGANSSTLAAGGPAELLQLKQARALAEQASRRAEQTLPWKNRRSFFRVSEPKLLVKSPDDRTMVLPGLTSYTRLKGQEMVLWYAYMRTSDVYEELFYCSSTDNGRTWSQPTSLYRRDTETDALTATGMVVPSGPLVRGNRNPFTGEVIVFSDQRKRPADALLDLPTEYWTQTELTWAVSRDDGRTLGAPRPLIKQGAAFNEQHPFDGLVLGQNQVRGMYEALFLDADTFLIPVVMSVLGPDGGLFTTLHYDYEQVSVLVARRSGDAFVWDCTPPITLDGYSQSTRGATEPTLGLLMDGSILVVMRGSNANKPELPGWKWVCTSRDQGRSWSIPQPWTYDTGERFFSPSSISKLVPHSSGRLFWCGNIVPSNAETYGNGRRYPLVIAEVDRASGLLIKSSVTVVADRKAQMHERVQLSNFGIYEDRLTGELVINLPHVYPNATGMKSTGELFCYRVAV